MRARRRDDSGAVALEFALLLPLLLVLIFGVVDFGRTLNAQIALTHAAREGVRASALGVSDVPSVVRNTATSTVSVDTVSVTPCPSTATNPPQNTTVVVTAKVTFITPIAALVPGLGTSITVTGRGVEQCFA